MFGNFAYRFPGSRASERYGLGGGALGAFQACRLTGLTSFATTSARKHLQTEYIITSKTICSARDNNSWKCSSRPPRGTSDFLQMLLPISVARTTLRPYMQTLHRATRAQGNAHHGHLEEHQIFFNFCFGIRPISVARATLGPYVQTVHRATTTQGNDPHDLLEEHQIFFNFCFGLCHISVAQATLGPYVQTLHRATTIVCRGGGRPSADLRPAFGWCSVGT
jgi:hypothetical protein